MKLLKNFFGHLKTVIKHRWFVFLHCCYAGIPLQGLIHDLSKIAMMGSQLNLSEETEDNIKKDIEN